MTTFDMVLWGVFLFWVCLLCFLMYLWYKEMKT